MVEAELKIDVSDDIKAASITANIRPLIPETSNIKCPVQLKMLYNLNLLFIVFIEELKGVPEFNEYLTMRHDFQDQFDVGDVGAAFFAETDLFAFFRL